MSNKKKLNWGIMGAGIIAKNMANALALNPESYLYAVASKTPSKARLFADEFGIENTCSYQKLVDCKEIDVIYVAMTQNFHFENAKLALEHGKYVSVVNSFTVNAKQARELFRLAREKNLFLLETMWVRFLPTLKTLRSKIQAMKLVK